MADEPQRRRRGPPGAIAARTRSFDDSSLRMVMQEGSEQDESRMNLLSTCTRALVMIGFLYFLYLNVDRESNATFAQNPFFSESGAFTPEAIANLSRIFVGRYYAPGELLRNADTVSDFFIVENGSCSSIRLEHEPEGNRLRGYMRRGEAIGGLNMLYGRPSLHAVRANDDEGAFVWQASSAQLVQLLSENLVLAGVMERKFLQTFVVKRDKKPLLLFPGFASTQLISWKHKQCSGVGSIAIGERVWVNLEKVLHHNFFEGQCWIKCMALDIVDQTDPVDCKLRPEEGLAAINNLMDGPLGQMTTIFGTLVHDMAQHFGYDSSSVLALPYDWRLAPRKLQERDALFSKIKLEIEHIVALNKNPGIALCHSMGCSVFLYFLRWIEHALPDTHQEWIDRHVWMNVQVAAPLLGSSQAVKGMLSGMTFSLPIDPQDARIMGASFSSGHWLLPQNCTPPKDMDPRIAPPSRWYSDLVTVVDEADEGAEPATFGYKDLMDGRLFETLAKDLSDDDFRKFARVQQRYYHEDPVYNPLDGAGPSRPGVRKILALYGTNVPTDIGYRYRIVRPDEDDADDADIYERAGRRTKPARHASYLSLEAEIFEGVGGVVYARVSNDIVATTTMLGQSGYAKSGDGTVPYASLSWANTWHYPNVSVTEHPATLRLDLDKLLGQLGAIGGSISSSVVQSFNTLEPAHTKYESSYIDDQGRVSDVTVIELDSLSHRDVIRDLFMVKVFKDEFLWQVRKEFLAERTALLDEADRRPIESLWKVLNTFSRKFRELAASEQLLSGMFANTSGKESKLVGEEAKRFADMAKKGHAKLSEKEAEEIAEALNVEAKLADAMRIEL